MATKSLPLVATLVLVATFLVGHSAAERNEAEILQRKLNDASVRIKPQVHIALPIVRRPIIIRPPRVHPLPIHPIPIRPHPIHPIPIRPHPIIRRTTLTPFTTPAMVDPSTWNFTSPSDIAKDCLNGMHSIVDMCRNNASQTWDASKMNTTKTTVWETCCDVMQEMSCYQKNAQTFCPSATGRALVAYTRKMGSYFVHSICKTITLYNWKSACNTIAHQHRAQTFNDTTNKHPNYHPHFIDLPRPDGPEKTCFTKLRANKDAQSGKRVDLEQKCINSSLTIWDPAHKKLVDSTSRDSCCALYMALDCVQKESTSVCSTKEAQDMANYHKKSIIAFTSTVCKQVPYDKAASLCKNGSNAVVPSLLVTLTAAILFAANIIRF